MSCYAVMTGQGSRSVTGACADTCTHTNEAGEASEAGDAGEAERVYMPCWRQVARRLKTASLIKR